MQVGLVIRDKHSWLGASPDALIWSKDRQGFGILEVKCLESFIGKPLRDVPCLDENEKLKTTDPWYYQIQITAWCCNANYAILFLYNGGTDVKEVEVPISHTWV